MRGRAALGGVALGATAGWNLANVGAVAETAAHAYGVGLAVVGLFTTSLFVTHALLQVPAGRLCDRVGARLVGGSGLLIVAAGSAAALTWRDPWFAIGMRAIVGVGTAAAFVSGSDYIRKSIGSPLAQGLYGACSVGSVGPRARARAAVGNVAGAVRDGGDRGAGRSCCWSPRRRASRSVLRPRACCRRSPTGGCCPWPRCTPRRSACR